MTFGPRNKLKTDVSSEYAKIKYLNKFSDHFRKLNILNRLHIGMLNSVSESQLNRLKNQFEQRFSQSQGCMPERR